VLSFKGVSVAKGHAISPDLFLETLNFLLTKNSGESKMKLNLKRGFTLIELVIVIIVIGILAAIAVPAYYDLKSDAQDSARAGLGGTARSGIAIALAENKTTPTVAQVAAVTGGTAAGDNSGINYDVDGTTYKVRTFSNTSCTTATDGSQPGTSNLVLCVLDPTSS
jgi:MSHA pilin protein MshA